jgi:hypothetical protein
MHKIPKITNLPNGPAIYALFGGKGKRKFIAYVGIADKLRQRVSQHLVRRDSSIVTGTSVVSLNPDYVTRLKWWEHPTFSKRDYLEAAEIIAFEIFDPILRSRGKLSRKADELLKDVDFQREMRSLFSKESKNEMNFPDFQDVLDKIIDLENKIHSLKKREENEQN